MSFEQDHRLSTAPGRDTAPPEDYRSAPAPARRSRVSGVVIGFLIAALLMGGAFWWGYELGDSGDEGVFPPLIRADRAPIREAPEEPGGLQVPNQDSLVFDGVNEGRTAPAEVAVLSAPPEEPLARTDAARSALVTGDGENSAATIRVIEGGGEQTTAALVAPPPPPPLADDSLSASPRVARPRDEITIERVATETVVPDKPQVAAAVAVEPPAPTPSAGPPKPVVASAGTFRVQVGSYRTEAGALNGWKVLQTAHRTLLKDLTPTVVTADLGVRGVFHRLQAGPLGAQSSAQSLCESLKARNQGCLVVRP